MEMTGSFGKEETSKLYLSSFHISYYNSVLYRLCLTPSIRYSGCADSHAQFDCYVTESPSRFNFGSKEAKYEAQQRGPPWQTNLVSSVIVIKSLVIV